MGLMDMIKGLGNTGARSGAGSGLPAGFNDSQLVGAGAGAGGGGVLMHATRAEVEAYNTATMQETEAADTSIITEAAPSDLGAYADAIDSQPAAVAEVSALPFIGNKPLAAQQRILGGAIVVGIAGLLLMMFLALNSASKSAAQLNASGQALMQSQRLAKSVSQAAIGNAKAFGEVRESSEALSRTVFGLQSGDAEIAAAPRAVQEAIEPLVPLVERATRNASIVLAHQKVLTQVAQALQAINRQSSELLQTAEGISLIKLQQEATASELSAAGQLVMLTQRIGKSANEFLTAEGASAQAMALLGKDLTSFRAIAQGLLDGSGELRLPPARDPQLRASLNTLLKQYEETRVQAAAILDNLPGLLAVRKAQAAIIAESEMLRQGLEEVQSQLSLQGGFSGAKLLAMAFFALLMVGGGFGFLRLYMQDQAQRAAVAETQRLQAERMEQEAKRVNDANQAAILRLMNELQSVAEGDLTQQATVTEDITGAIADSVNYTVEELRTLVSQVQGTVGRVTDTTQQVEATSTELMAASSEQLREIRDTGESVLQMAGRINDVSAQAQQTAQVARQSLAAAESGLHAVQNTIGGMNSIRDQIQE
ncbi:MAG: type IV pili methyl-accepting chemotaxis transducer N-terminal domain-containing protein, partial [Burkholderiales bacterium]